MNFLFIKFVRFFCVILSPLTLLLFRKYFWHLLKTGSRSKLANISNTKFILYVLLLLDYQLLRYFIAWYMAMTTGKIVLVDEGFLYNTIRLRTFMLPNISNEANLKLTQCLAIFSLSATWVKVNRDLALRRFQEREKHATEKLYQLWAVRGTEENWMPGAWGLFENWHEELAKSPHCCVIPILIGNDLLGAVKDLRNRLMA